jgi:hypothetical protein
MNYDKMKVDELKCLCKERGIKGFSGKSKAELINLVSSDEPASSGKTTKDLLVDNYTPDVLHSLYQRYKDNYQYTANLKKEKGLPIRQQNPPEDITENIVKFIIQNYEGDLSCKWAKAIGKNGDLYSDKYNHEYPIEVKAFTSNGPSQFGPRKKFGVLYFLDMRNWLDNKLVLWRVNLTNDSQEMKNIKMNKKQTLGEQCDEGRRPHICWDSLYPQIMDKSVKIYEGTFDDIFRRQEVELGV